jgi:hypothetical protein
MSNPQTLHPPNGGTGVSRSCNHKWIHLDTNKTIEDHYPSWCKTYKKIDRFYCENCLETKEIIKKECTMDKPDWYY